MLSASYVDRCFLFCLPMGFHTVSVQSKLIETISAMNCDDYAKKVAGVEHIHEKPINKFVTMN